MDYFEERKLKEDKVRKVRFILCCAYFAVLLIGFVLFGLIGKDSYLENFCIIMTINGTLTLPIVLVLIEDS